MSDCSIDLVFAGDLDDPWVRAIADGLPRGTPRLDLPGDLPDDWPALVLNASVFIVHRDGLGDGDLRRLAALRARPGGPPQVLLCAGSHSRYHQINEWSGVADLVIDEATAPAVAPLRARRLRGEAPTDRRIGRGRRVNVLADDSAMRGVLVDALVAYGFAATDSADSNMAAEIPSVWAVPVLDDGWELTLTRLAETRPILALLGLIDRDSARRAIDLGASACLGLPCDPEDLAVVIDRLASGPSVGGSDRQ